jgi:hypothetical protein
MWLNIRKHAYSKTVWLLFRYGKAHALFHAIRLGPNFIDESVCTILFAMKIPFSRYLFQELQKQFGQVDQLLINIRTYRFNTELIRDVRDVQQPLSSNSSWASNLPVNVYSYLILEGAKLYKNLPFKGDDMELFVSCSEIPANNLINDILKDLILNKKFIPFPQKQIISYDGFSDMMIAKAIVTYPYLVNFWKQIGYYEICNDYNDLVLQWALTMLFSPSPAVDWTCPSTKTVTLRLNEFISLGFKLNNKAIISILKSFEDRLYDIMGCILCNSFRRI